MQIRLPSYQGEKNWPTLLSSLVTHGCAEMCKLDPSLTLRHFTSWLVLEAGIGAESVGNPSHKGIGGISPQEKLEIYIQRVLLY